MLIDQLVHMHRSGFSSAVLAGGVDASAAERQAWIDAERESCGDEDTWQQEYMCNPVDEASAWLPWELIVACESPEAGVATNPIVDGECYVGWDVARTSDKSVIWAVQKIGDVFWTRLVVPMRRTSFAEQLDRFDVVMRMFNVRRACIDKTGLGMPIVEEAQRRWGEYRVEGVTFTGEVKQHLATYGKQLFEDKRVRIPVSRDIRDSHHSVRKTMTVAGNPRFDADRNESGHADEFWAHMLALHAGETNLQPSAGATVDADPADLLPDAMRGRRRSTMFGRASRAVGVSSDGSP